MKRTLKFSSALKPRKCIRTYLNIPNYYIFHFSTTFAMMYRKYCYMIGCEKLKYTYANIEPLDVVC